MGKILSTHHARSTRRVAAIYTFSRRHASAYPGAGEPYSLAVTRARDTRCRQRKAGRVAANSSDIAW